MRYLLIPFSLLIQYAIVYYSTYYLIVASFVLFSLNWLWIIFGFGILTGLISFIFSVIPSLIQLLVTRIYKGNSLVLGFHSVASLLAIISLLHLFYEYPAMLVAGDNEIPIFRALWQAYPLKCLIIFPSIIGMLFSQIYGFVIGPFMHTQD